MVDDSSGTGQGSAPADPSDKLAENTRLFAIRLTAPGRDGPIGFAIAERIFFLSAQDARDANVSGITYNYLHQLFEEANPEIIAEAIPIQASPDPLARGLLGEVNPRSKGEVNPRNPGDED